MTEQEEHTAIGILVKDLKAAQQRLICLESKSRSIAINLDNISHGLSGRMLIAETSGEISVSIGDVFQQVIYPSKEDIVTLIKELSESRDNLKLLQEQWDRIKPT